MSETQKVIGQQTDFKNMYKTYRKYLKNAKDGEVVTRFPPEPSGYLHVGHVKAALLNYHYAKMFNGKMILRFDDTNPAKENADFQKAILEDLKTIGIIPDMITNTKKAEEFIKNGFAYCDDTDGDTMKDERMKKIESKHRNQTTEETLKLFKLMIQGDEKVKDHCLRVRINMKSDNGCMRDPVIFRKCLIPHHTTGTKYKIYPTYDFACPIVDSHEGVTHALRSNEYSDRNPLYEFMLKKMGLRKVKIQDFSRLNFVKTTLSKRKLNWFVDSGTATGWDDPRFPTVRGIMRRGMTVASLTEFMLEQGPSKNTNLMEWDKIWSLNRKMLDKECHRYTAITTNNAKLEVVDTDDKFLECFETPLHPKKKNEGLKTVAKGKNLIVEQEDMENLNQGDKLILLKWGVFEIVKADKENKQFQVKYLPEDKDFKSPPKITWLNNDPVYLVDIEVEIYDHLLSKDKPEGDQDFKDIINTNSKEVQQLVGEGMLKNLDIDQKVQFERKGFYRLDKKQILNQNTVKLVFINIPEGKQKTMGGKTTKIQ